MTNIVQSIFRSIDRFFFASCDPIPFSYIRIVFGILIIASLFCLSPNWEAYYSASGIPSLIDSSVPSMRVQWWSVFYWFEKYINISSFWWIELVAAILFTFGFMTRSTASICFLIETAALHRNWAASNAEQTIFRMFLFYSLFCPVSRTLSLDSIIRRWKIGKSTETHNSCAVWGLRLLQLNIFLIYVISLPQKIFLEEAWRNGEAMYYVMLNSQMSRWPWPSLFYYSFTAKIFTYGTLIAEGLFPLLAWHPRMRTLAAVAMIVLHVSIAIFLQSVTIFTLSVAALWLAFIPGATLRRWSSKIPLGKFLLSTAS